MSAPESEPRATAPEPAVVGLMALRDEWPLCAVSISHLLGGHVDSLWVLDHASGAETADGLGRLMDIWGDRLHVLRLDDVSFHQEAITAVLLERSGARAGDWVYVADADEFVLPANGSSLRSFLATVTEGTSVIRYAVENWVSHRDFDGYELDDYRRLTYRAVPHTAFDGDVVAVRDEVEAGRANYFDVPFESKVAFRLGQAAWIESGSHDVKLGSPGGESMMAPAALRVAHLPMSTFDHLVRKRALGAIYAEQGYPPEHGWQAQMFHRLWQAGTLDAFWQRHTTDTGAGAGTGRRPTLQRDDGLVEALEPTLALLAAHFGPRLDSPPGGSATRPERPAAERTISVGTAVRLAHAIQSVGRDLTAEYRRAATALADVTGQRDRMSAVLDEVIAERDAIAARFAELAAERNLVAADRDRIADERDQAGAALDRLADERDRVAAERDRLAEAVTQAATEQRRLDAELSAVVRSRSWRLTGPLRAAARRLRPGA